MRSDRMNKLKSRQSSIGSLLPHMMAHLAAGLPNLPQTSAPYLPVLTKATL